MRYRLSMLEAHGFTLNGIDRKESGPKLNCPAAFGRRAFGWHNGLVQASVSARSTRFMLPARLNYAPTNSGRSTNVRRSWPRRLGSTRTPERGASLRRDDAAQRMAARQDDAAMIHFHHCVGLPFGRSISLNQRAAAGRAPVGLRGLGQHGMALAAGSLHAKSLSHWSSRGSTLFPRSLGPSFPRSLPLVHWRHAPSGSTGSDRRGRHVAAGTFTKVERAHRAVACG